MARAGFTLHPPPHIANRLRPRSWPRIVRILVAGGAGLLLFLALYLFPDLGLMGMLAFAALLPALAISWVYPEFGLVGLVFIGSRVLDPGLLEVRLPIGGGLELPDLALLGLVGLSLLRQARDWNLHLPASWVLPPVLVWVWLGIFSALMATLMLEVEFNWAMSELRGIGYYAIFLLVVWDIKTPAQLTRLLTGLFAIGLFIVAIMLVQQFVGPVPLFAGQESTSWQIIGSGSGITRIRPPAHVLLYFLSVLSFVASAYVRSPAARLGLFGIAVFMNAALLLTFTRSQWVASVIALGLAYAFFPRQIKVAFAGLAAAVVLVGAVLFATQQDAWTRLTREVNFATPLVERVESVFELETTLDSYSARNRYFQTDAALDSIARHPVLGVGLGNAYRGLTNQEALSRYTRFVRFVENSYLYMTVKMGLLGLLVFAWFAVTVLWQALRHYRAATLGLLKGTSLACFVAFIGLLAWAFNHPLFMLSEYTIMVGLIAGVSEAVGLMQRGEGQ